jgi:hypothetical protein
VAASILLLLEFGVKWQNTWAPAALSRTQVFSYRGSRAAKLPNTPVVFEVDRIAE